MAGMEGGKVKKSEAKGAAQRFLGEGGSKGDEVPLDSQSQKEEVPLDSQSGLRELAGMSVEVMNISETVAEQMRELDRAIASDRKRKVEESEMEKTEKEGKEREKKQVKREAKEDEKEEVRYGNIWEPERKKLELEEPDECKFCKFQEGYCRMHKEEWQKKYPTRKERFDAHFSAHPDPINETRADESDSFSCKYRYFRASGKEATAKEFWEEIKLRRCWNCGVPMKWCDVYTTGTGKAEKDIAVASCYPCGGTKWEGW